jgi:hypothetical protein
MPIFDRYPIFYEEHVYFCFSTEKIMAQESVSQQPTNQTSKDEHSRGGSPLGPILCWAVVFPTRCATSWRDFEQCPGSESAADIMDPRICTMEEVEIRYTTA